MSQSFQSFMEQKQKLCPRGAEPAVKYRAAMGVAQSRGALPIRVAASEETVTAALITGVARKHSVGKPAEVILIHSFSLFGSQICQEISWTEISPTLQ